MNLEFWKRAGIRALHTMAQAALAYIGTASILSEVDWKLVISTSILAGIISILKSLVVGLPEVGL